MPIVRQANVRDDDDDGDDDNNDDGDVLTLPLDLLQPEPGRGQRALRPRPHGDLPAGGAEGGLGPAAHPPAAGQRGRGGHRPGQGNPLLDTQPPARTLQGDMIICGMIVMVILCRCSSPAPATPASTPSPMTTPTTTTSSGSSSRSSRKL